MTAITQTLAGFAARLRYEDIPREVIERTELLVLDLAGRGVGDVEDAQVVGLGGAGTALDDVGGYGDGPTSELGGQPEEFLPWERAGVLVDGERQAVCQFEGS